MHIFNFIPFVAVSLIAAGCRHHEQAVSEVGTHATNSMPAQLATPTTKAKTSDSVLERLVGQTVTLRGQFELFGKTGPYIRRTGDPVYLPAHSSFCSDSQYQQMQGKVVSITGVLRFKHFDRVKTNALLDQPYDYFYLDDTAKVRLE